MMNQGSWIRKAWTAHVFFALLLLPGIALAAGEGRTSVTTIPVILHTDIGDDIDDTWALAFLLRCPELDLKLVLTDTGDPEYRARLTAKLLDVAGRSDVPVGIGLPLSKNARKAQEAWLKDYDLSSYKGRVHKDGVQALIDTIMGSSETVTLLSIGPVPALAAALEREPRIAQKARFVGMHGSLRIGYENKPPPAQEWNVAVDPVACQKVFTAPWKMMTITPLDTCGTVRLQGRFYDRVRASDDPLVRAVVENYRVWLGPKQDVEKTTSVLFDTVAVYLAFSEQLLKIEELGVRVTDDGKTVIDPAARMVRCATEWKDFEKFKELLVNRLVGPTM